MLIDAGCKLPGEMHDSPYLEHFGVLRQLERFGEQHIGIWRQGGQRITQQFDLLACFIDEQLIEYG